MTFRQLGHFDVVVMGAGSAGATAAIAAARAGSNVLVIDRLLALLSLILFMGFTPQVKMLKK
jgi:pyruvate/2-oxoglutarate dehydrogenase complex dihydrolipoamide dehydrogenase (E3) component